MKKNYEAKGEEVMGRGQLELRNPCQFGNKVSGRSSLIGS